MPRYTVNHRYLSTVDGGQYGPWQPGTPVELQAGEAEWLNRSSPGLLTPIEEEPSGAADNPGGATAPDPDADPVVGDEDEAVPDGAAQVVLAWVADQPDLAPQRARLALDAELAKGSAARTTLVAALEKLAGERSAVPARDRMHRGGQNRAVGA